MTGPGWPDARGWIGVSVVAVTIMLLWMMKEDPALREDLLGLIESQGKVPGRTLIIVTHDEPVARRIARRVLSLLPAAPRMA